MQDVTVRPLNENDAHAFQDLRLKGLQEHPDAFASTYEREVVYSTEFVAERLRRTAESPNNFTLGAFREEELLGLVGFYRKTGEKEQHRGHIWGMYVRSDEQGKGIGKALLSKAIDLAEALPRAGTDRALRRHSQQAGAKPLRLSRLRLVRLRSAGTVRRRRILSRGTHGPYLQLMLRE